MTTEEEITELRRLVLQARGYGDSLDYNSSLHTQIDVLKRRLLNAEVKRLCHQSAFTREEILNALMRSKSTEVRNRWCEGTCGCMGCANRSGGLCDFGFTKQDWEKWL